MANYLVRFVNHLDPNGGLDLVWPKYTNTTPTLLTFQDKLPLQTLTTDTFRVDGINAIINLLRKYPL